MIIDRYFNPDQNFLTLASSILLQLKSDGVSDVTEFLSRLEAKFPGSYETYAFEALGFLFLVGKLSVDSKTDKIGLNNEAI